MGIFEISGLMKSRQTGINHGGDDSLQTNLQAHQLPCVRLAA